MIIGVLALQGAVGKHIESIRNCGAEATPVKTKEELKKVNGLIIPGGESTTIGKLLVRFGLIEELKKLAQNGLPVFGTCTGMILLAKDILGSDQPRLGLMNITVERNAFGRQVDSFETDLTIPAIGDKSFRAVFIRAPYITNVKNSVDVLAKFEDKIILAREGKFLSCAFHPELTDDTRVHQYFLNIIKNMI